MSVVQQEKQQQNLLHGVESFDKSALKHTDTQEKGVLPDPEGDCVLLFGSARATFCFADYLFFFAER